MDEDTNAKVTKTDVDGEQQQPETVIKSVRFKDVYVREYNRSVGGGGGVPGSGCWSLGLGHMKTEYVVGTVDEFESRRAKELEDRTKAISDPHLRSIANGETRQFSHRSGASNPLMGRRDEKERKTILKENLLANGSSDIDDRKSCIDEDVFMNIIAEDKKEVYEIRKSRQHGNQGCDCSLSNAKKFQQKN